MASLNCLPKTPILFRINSALVSACFVFCLLRLCKDPCTGLTGPWELAESRRRNVRLPQRPYGSDQNPSATCTRLRALSLMHKAVPQPRCAACSAVLGSSLDCVWPDVARLLVPLYRTRRGSILQGYCNKKTLFSNPCRCASQYRSTCLLEWAFFS
jgi:hypothetical protein